MNSVVFIIGLSLICGFVVSKISATENVNYILFIISIYFTLSYGRLNILYGVLIGGMVGFAMTNLLSYISTSYKKSYSKTYIIISSIFFISFYLG